MRVEPNIRWNARRAGGLFLGVRYSFPCSAAGEVIQSGYGLRFTLRTLQLGFILFTISFDIITNPIPYAEI